VSKRSKFSDKSPAAVAEEPKLEQPDETPSTGHSWLDIFVLGHVQANDGRNFLLRATDPDKVGDPSARPRVRENKVPFSAMRRVLEAVVAGQTPDEISANHRVQRFLFRDAVNAPSERTNGDTGFVANMDFAGRSLPRIPTDELSVEVRRLINRVWPLPHPGDTMAANAWDAKRKVHQEYIYSLILAIDEAIVDRLRDGQRDPRIVFTKDLTKPGEAPPFFMSNGGHYSVHPGLNAAAIRWDDIPEGSVLREYNPRYLPAASQGQKDPVVFLGPANQFNPAIQDNRSDDPSKDGWTDAVNRAKDWQNRAATVRPFYDLATTTLYCTLAFRTWTKQHIAFRASLRGAGEDDEGLYRWPETLPQMRVRAGEVYAPPWREQPAPACPEVGAYPERPLVFADFLRDYRRYLSFPNGSVPLADLITARRILVEPISELNPYPSASAAEAYCSRWYSLVQQENAAETFGSLVLSTRDAVERLQADAMERLLSIHQTNKYGVEQ
jgi:hypothetical protein